MELVKLETISQIFTIIGGGGVIIGVIALLLTFSGVQDTKNLLNQSKQSTENLKVLVNTSNNQLKTLNSAVSQISQQTIMQAYLTEASFSVEVRNCTFDKVNKIIQFYPVITYGTEHKLSPLKFNVASHFGFYTTEINNQGISVKGSQNLNEINIQELLDPGVQNWHEQDLSGIFQDVKNISDSYLYIRSSYDIAPYSDALDRNLVNYVHDQGFLLLAFSKNKSTNDWEIITEGTRSICK